jgi:predicted permease
MGFVFLLVMATGRLMGFAPSQIGSLAQGSFRGNIAYVGLALVANIYGPQGLSKAGVLAGFMIPFMNFFSILGLVIHSSQIQGLLSWKSLIRSILLNALILGSFLGLLFSFFSWTLPPILANTLKMISGLSLPLALLSLGGSLSVQGIRGGLIPTIWASFLKLLGLPLIGYALLQSWDIGGLDLKVTILLLSCPTAVVTYIMSSELGGDLDLSASIVMLTTIVSMITIALWVGFVGF